MKTEIAGKRTIKTMTDSFDLAKIAAALEGLEETIIFKLIDRAQYRHNPPAYQQGKSGFEQSGDESLFTLRLRSQEEMDAMFGRFSVAEERPFCPGLPRPKRRAMLPDTGLFLKDFDVVNLTGKIKAAYLDLVPKLCRQGEDGHFGSSVEHDVYALLASLCWSDTLLLSDECTLGRLVTALALPRRADSIDVTGRQRPRQDSLPVRRRNARRSRRSGARRATGPAISRRRRSTRRVSICSGVGRGVTSS
jgi:hypothetical protein